MLNHNLNALRHFHLVVPLFSIQALPLCTTSKPCTHGPHSNLLTLSSNAQTLHQTKQVHALALLNGLLPRSVSLCASLMLSYATFKSPDAPHRLFELTVRHCRTAFLWNTLIRACSVAQVDDGFRTYNQWFGAVSSSMTIVFLLFLRRVRTRMFDEMPERDVVSWNTIIGVFSGNGFYVEALHCYREMNLGLGASKQVFDEMIQRNEVSWNAAITSLSHVGNNMDALITFRLELEAIGLVRQMQAHGEIPNSVTITNLLPACARLVPYALEKKSTQGQFTWHLPLICLSLMLSQTCYSQTTDCSKSLSLFSEMKPVGMMHDIVSFVGVISACANLTAIKQGKEIHGSVFDRISNKDVASWNTMILGYGMLGELDTAISFFEAMREDGVEYDSVTYIAVLSSCSHGGLVEKGKRYFEEMLARNIEPTQKHYACMIDLLGRAGLMEEAVELIKVMPLYPMPIFGVLCLGRVESMGTSREMGRCKEGEGIDEIKGIEEKSCLQLGSDSRRDACFRSWRRLERLNSDCWLAEP
ncbi:hypothetical protein M0R45_000686 [Rubus argutus]|uniref:Pentatricopeptide repeat-containing protein n=1 Tax=Rubus argutus TaxID=59490 RepID=A0AAW1VM35_RUBAR